MKYNPPMPMSIKNLFKSVVEAAEHYNTATEQEANMLRVNSDDYETHFRWIEKRLYTEYGISIEVCD